MSQRIDEKHQTILYHALGANFKQGLALFEEHFAAEESDFQIEALESLLAVLGDSTLHDMHRQAWHSYYSARLAFMRWKPALVDQRLKEASIDESQELLPILPDLLELLEIRKSLLEGKNRILQGDWIRGITLLERAGQSAAAKGETAILLEADDARAAAYIAWARASGDWQKPAHSPLTHWLQRLLLIFLLPLYLALWIFLKARGLAILSKPAWRYGIYYSNWPIFWYYQQAYRAKTRQTSNTADQTSTDSFRTQMMWADLLRRLLADRQVNEIYQGELDQLPEKDDDITRYRKAQILQGLAGIEIHSGRPAATRVLLSEARRSYAALADWNSWAQTVLLLGDVALDAGVLPTALRNYSLAAQVLQQNQDLAGLTEALGRLYQLGETDLPQALAERLSQAVGKIQPKIFTVRMPGRLFDLLQLVSWALPVAVALGCAAVVSYLIIRSPVSGLNNLWQALFSWQSLLILVVVWLGIGLVQALLGLLGLASAQRASRMSLDYIVAAGDALEYRSLVRGRTARLLWGEIDAYLRVERGLWGKPAGALSFERLGSSQDNAIRLPGATTWYRQLQRTVQQKMDRQPQIHRLNGILAEIVLLMLFSALVFLGAFALAQHPLPRLEVSTRAWLASVATFLYYVAILAVTARWVLHFINVAYATAGKPGRLSWIAAAIAGGLIGIGLLLKPALLMWSPMFVGWGVVLLAAVLPHSAVFAHSSSRLLKWGLRAGVYLLGSLLVLRTILPIAINLYGFTYLGAASGFNPQHPSPPEQSLRSTYFEQMHSAGVWMNRIDPTHPFAYGYLGYAAYWEGNFAQSIAFYDRGARSFTPFQAPPDFNYCRALAYREMGAEQQAQDECRLFNDAGAAGTNCELLFPEAAGACSDLP
jgi:hypothetical protein